MRRGYGTVKAIQAAFGNPDFGFFNALTATENDAQDAAMLHKTRQRMNS